MSRLRRGHLTMSICGLHKVSTVKVVGHSFRRYLPLEHWGHPYDINAQILQVIHLADDTGDIPQAISVAIHEAGRIDLAVSGRDDAAIQYVVLRSRGVLEPWGCKVIRKTSEADSLYHAFLPPKLLLRHICGVDSVLKFQDNAWFCTSTFGGTITVAPPACKM